MVASSSSDDFARIWIILGIKVVSHSSKSIVLTNMLLSHVKLPSLYLCKKTQLDSIYCFISEISLIPKHSNRLCFLNVPRNKQSDPATLVLIEKNFNLSHSSSGHR
jgi:hypothetical protein